jgi:hypothetical protein
MLDIAQNIAPPISCFAAVRVQRLKTMRQLESATKHANREDETSKLRARPGANRLDNLAFNPWAEERRHEPNFDYVADFKKMKDTVKVGERNGTAMITHMICVISPEWIAKTGDVHDPQNPRNLQVLDAGIGWAKENFGEQALVSARMDLDENGAGVVDVFVAPAARTKKGKAYLSISPRLKEIQRHYRARNTFSGLQDSWAEWAQLHLDPSIKRGKEKETKGPDRISPENYRARAENEKERKRLEIEREAITRDRVDLAHEIDQVEKAKKEIAESRRALDQFSRELDERLAKIQETEERQRLAQARADKERIDLENRRASLERQVAVEREAGRRQGLQEGRDQAKTEAAREYDLARQRGLAQGRSEAVEETRNRLKYMEVATKAAVDGDIREVVENGEGFILNPGLEEKRYAELLAVMRALSSGDRIAVGVLAAGRKQAEKDARGRQKEEMKKANKLYAATHAKAMKDGLAQAAQLIGNAFRVGVMALIDDRIEFRSVGEGRDHEFRIVPAAGQKDDDHRKLLDEIAPALDYGLINLLKHIAWILAQMREVAASVKKQMSVRIKSSANVNVPER